MFFRLSYHMQKKETHLWLFWRWVLQWWTTEQQPTNQITGIPGEGKETQHGLWQIVQYDLGTYQNLFSQLSQRHRKLVEGFVHANLKAQSRGTNHDREEQWSIGLMIKAAPGPFFPHSHAALRNYIAEMSFCHKCCSENQTTVATHETIKIREVILNKSFLMYNLPLDETLYEIWKILMGGEYC